MRTRSTFSLLFWVNTSRLNNNQVPVYARVTVNGKRVNISLKRKVILSEWDSAKSKLKGSNQEAKLFNRFLEQVRSQIYLAYEQLLSENKLITAQAIKARYLGEDEQHRSLLELFEYHNTTMSKNLHKDTMRHYKTTQNYLKSFLSKKIKTDNIYLSNLDYSFIVDFEYYLKAHEPTDHQRKISNNTAMKHLQRLRKMVTMAYHLEWIDRDPFVRFKSSFEKREREFLSESELLKLENFHSPVNRLNIVKDLFVFSCYTGISYIDLNNLTRDNIVKGIDGNDWLITKRQKTKTNVKIPLLDKALELVFKYENHPRVVANNGILPRLSNQRINAYLKEIADLCKIKKNLTFHMARHTFATTITLSNGVPIETVSKLLGHTKIATTQIYARVIERKVSEDINTLKIKMINKNNQKIHSKSK
ncbi:integrase [Mangrovimonas yunxiaonensis]|uniref:Integrase n=1 Tax=Mangrovimonas yunxiaonensis TaxID=1197477 RepID=A0A084THP4_9FLAO|nr:site-specific integrase [Mangrovimonas yunxiaonensis]KFB00230.1 integrase [Mangrovimonas yunxiaonensis]GGH42719.1 transposase [Mangrovimonas yunxiaonensis]